MILRHVLDIVSLKQIRHSLVSAQRFNDVCLLRYSGNSVVTNTVTTKLIANFEQWQNTIKNQNFRRSREKKMKNKYLGVFGLFFQKSLIQYKNPIFIREVEVGFWIKAVTSRPEKGSTRGNCRVSSSGTRLLRFQPRTRKANVNHSTLT